MGSSLSGMFRSYINLIRNVVLTQTFIVRGVPLIEQDGYISGTINSMTSNK